MFDNFSTGWRPISHKEQCEEVSWGHLHHRACNQSFFPNFWPPRSPYLTPVDFWYWGNLKRLVYAPGPPLTMANLKAWICRAVQQITLNDVRPVLASVIDRLQMIQECDGGHIEWQQFPCSFFPLLKCVFLKHLTSYLVRALHLQWYYKMKKARRRPTLTWANKRLSWTNLNANLKWNLSFN